MEGTISNRVVFVFSTTYEEAIATVEFSRIEARITIVRSF